MKKNHGFTLIEIIVTVALIGVMMALTIPGIMNYFKDVDMDKATSEANSVMAMVQSYQDKLSLSGNDSSSGDVTITDETILAPIVERAKGTGEVVTVTFEDGKITKFQYDIFEYEIHLSATGKLIVMNAGDPFY